MQLCRPAHFRCKSTTDRPLHIATSRQFVAAHALPPRATICSNRSKQARCCFAGEFLVHINLDRKTRGPSFGRGERPHVCAASDARGRHKRKDISIRAARGTAMQSGVRCTSWPTRSSAERRRDAAAETGERRPTAAQAWSDSGRTSPALSGCATNDASIGQVAPGSDPGASQGQSGSDPRASQYFAANLRRLPAALSVEAELGRSYDVSPSWSQDTPKLTRGFPAVLGLCVNIEAITQVST